MTGVYAGPEGVCGALETDPEALCMPSTSHTLEPHLQLSPHLPSPFSILVSSTLARVPMDLIPKQMSSGSTRALESDNDSLSNAKTLDLLVLSQESPTQAFSTGSGSQASVTR